MSELKDLSWAVQETVEPPGFEQLERRGVRRRRRRQALTSAGVVGVAALAVLAVLLPFGTKAGTEKPPVATIPTAPSVPPVDKDAQKLVNDPAAMIGAARMATPTRWAATWMLCPADDCSFAAVLHRDGQQAYAPVRKQGYVTLQDGDEAIAVAGPTGTPLSQNDKFWADTLLVRWTASGLSKTRLHWAKPTKTFQPGEILTDQFGELLVLNPAESTLRKLEWSADQYASSPVLDSTGRWWLVTGTSGDAPDSWVSWTDNGGKTWEQTLLDPDNGASIVTVSPDGQTVLASSGGDGSTPEAIVTMKMSTDRGAHWSTVTGAPWGRASGPIAFDDHTATLLGQQDPDSATLSIYTIAEGKATLVTSAPATQLDNLYGDGDLLYSTTASTTGAPATKLATSSDHGKTWKFFEPR
jgi:hypothetical protein